ncbi:thioredoxin [Polycladidibacter stylochi]|uniref:thioredoxin n=1 Tax=Polycladidibacter stylochi TaxID=1807766 RepID=UPI0009EB819D|nr:thioredoxin [Pseudovibrio stylochi]
MSGSGFSVGGRLAGGMGAGYSTATAAPTTSNASQPAASELIKDTTTQSFMSDVIEASSQQPVLVDFWAPWCQPCKQLGPVIEKVVQEARGAVKLVKMNIEDYPEIAGQMGVQSIPAVVVFKNGQPVDGFMGAQPESQIKALIEKHGIAVGPSDTEQYLEAAEQAREAGQYSQAAQLYANVLGQEAGHVVALSGLAQCYIATGNLDGAAQLLEAVEEKAKSEQAYVAAVAALELAQLAEDLGDLGALIARIEANPADHQARFELAVGLNAKGKKQEAVDQLIESLRVDREWNEEACKKQLLQFFEAWGFKDSASVYGRRKLSALLFA